MGRWLAAPTMALSMSVMSWSAVEAMPDPLLGSEWAPELIGAEPVAEGIEAFVRFEIEGRVVGNAGCNRFTGTYEVEGDRLQIGPLAATRMACPPPQMAAEEALFDALEATAAFRRDEQRLMLVDANGEPAAVFRQNDPD